MRVRALDANGDMTLGQGSANFYQNSSAGVAQCIITRLKLIKGEWFLDITAGTDWNGKILGRQSGYDAEIRRVILATPGVTSITTYSSALTGRALSISATVLTAYSVQPVAVQASLP